MVDSPISPAISPAEHDARLDRLDAAISAAQTRLSERKNNAHDDLGGLLETLNDEVQAARGQDPHAVHARLSSVEEKLSDVEQRLVEGVVPD